LVIVAGTVGYAILGFGFVDALYQTVTTITTVGFREVHPLSTVGQLFTIALILVGVGTALYTFGILLEALIEGHLRQQLRRRQMDRQIRQMTGHFIICGGGRVGRAAVLYLDALGKQVVVVDQDPAPLQGLDYPTLLGDVTDDNILQAAGIGHAYGLIAALNTDANNVYVTLSSRALRPDLVIIARARTEDSRSKLLRAGANRAVNPQLIGGQRMAAFALHPHVAEFLDVVMHDETLDYRIEEIKISPASPMVGRCLADTALGFTTGALVLAIRIASGQFIANPAPDTRLDPDTILIALGTSAQLRSVRGHLDPVR
jgi:voltage-gated potassium channel